MSEIATSIRQALELDARAVEIKKLRGALRDIVPLVVPLLSDEERKLFNDARDLARREYKPLEFKP